MEALPDEAFPHSLGVHSGPPERVEVEFDALVADYVTQRHWHTSQSVQPIEAGRILMRLDVCVDAALAAWVLGFGEHARVVAPPRFEADIASRLTQAAERYRTLLR